MRQSKNKYRFILYGFFVVAITFVCLLVGLIAYIIITHKNVERQVQNIYDGIIPYPDSSIVLENSDFGDVSAFVCGTIFSQGWRGTNAPFSAVQKYYGDEFSGRGWKASSDDAPFIVDPHTIIELTILSPDSYSSFPTVVAAKQSYQTVYLVSVAWHLNSDCP